MYIYANVELACNLGGSQYPLLNSKMLFLRGIFASFIAFLTCVVVHEPSVQAWSKEGHAMTCKIAQVSI